MPSPLKIVQTNTFVNGMNTDVADDLLPNDVYRYMLNCNVMSSAEGNMGVVTNMKGNTLISTPLPAGENKTIGTANDEESNRFYFFTWNSEGLHCIFRFDEVTRSITKILENITDTGNIDIMKLDKDYLILHADVIRNSLLYWVDGLNDARKTNIDRLVDKTSTGYGTTVLQSFINAYKQTARMPPVGVYVTDNTQPFNRLYGAIRKFAQLFVYRDNERSTYSDWSAVVLPKKEPFTGISTIPTENNAIDITVQTGDMDVKQIEIVMQATNSEEGNEGILNWVLIATLDKKKLGISDNSQYTYRYYNNITPSTADQEKVIQPYSFIPNAPDGQVFAKRALVYAGGTEGFPAVEINTSLSISYTDLFISEGTQNEWNEPIFNYESGEGSVWSDYVTVGEDVTNINNVTHKIYVGMAPLRFQRIKLTVGNDVKDGNRFILQLTNGYVNDTFTIEYTATRVDTALSVANNIRSALVGTGRIYRKTPELPDTDIYNNTIDGSGNVTFEFIIMATRDKNYIRGSASVQPVQFNTLKDTGESIRNIKMGSSFKLGIEYEDFDGRKSLIYTEDALIVGIETINVAEGLQTSNISVQINHKPPVWARYYQIVRTEDLKYSDFIQLLIQEVVEVPTTADTEYLDLVVGSIYTYQKIHPNTSLSFQFEKGDRISLIGKLATDPIVYYPFFETEIIQYQDTVTERITSNFVTDGTAVVTVASTDVGNIGRFVRVEGSEREIIGVQSATEYQLNNTIGDSTAKTYLFYDLIDYRGTIRIKKPADPIVIENYSLVEIYKPSLVPQGNQRFFEFQKKFEIINAGTEDALHDANGQPQTATLPAIVEISEGTVYVRNRELPINNVYPGTQVTIHPIEDPSFSDFYPSLFNDNGRVNAEDTGQGVVDFGSRMRWSNNFIEDTRINGLNMFNNLDREDYNDQYGSFKLIRFDTNRIYGFKELKTTWVPVDSTLTQDNNGQALLVTTNRLLNPIQYLSYEGGIGNNPESWARNENQQYALYPNAGVVIRLGGNGTEPISKTFSLDSEVKRLISEAVTNEAKVFGGFDRKLGCYIITIEGFNYYIYLNGLSGWRVSEDRLPDSTNVEIVSLPLHGDAVLTGKEVSYNPDPNYTGPDSYSYRVFEDGSWSDPRSVCITINPVPPQTAWRVKESSYFCVTEDGGQTGYKGWATLEEYNIFDNVATGNEKPNDTSSIDYAAPIYDPVTCTVAPPVPVDVSYSVARGIDPYVYNGFVFYRNSIEVARILVIGPGTLSGIYFVGDNIDIHQITFPASTPWPPMSTANLTVKESGVEVYNQNTTTQVVELQSYSFVIPTGSTGIEAISTGSSTAPGYLTHTLAVDNDFVEGDVGVEIVDNTTSAFVININPVAGISENDYNVLDNLDLTTVKVKNNLGVLINAHVLGVSGYDQSSNVSPGDTYILNNVPKGSVNIALS